MLVNALETPGEVAGAAFALLQSMCRELPRRDASMLVMEQLSLFGDSQGKPDVLVSLVRLLHIILQRTPADAGSAASRCGRYREAFPLIEHNLSEQRALYVAFSQHPEMQQQLKHMQQLQQAQALSLSQQGQGKPALAAIGHGKPAAAASDSADGKDEVKAKSSADTSAGGGVSLGLGGTAAESKRSPAESKRPQHHSQQPASGGGGGSGGELKSLVLRAGGADGDLEAAGPDSQDSAQEQADSAAAWDNVLKEVSASLAGLGFLICSHLCWQAAGYVSLVSQLSQFVRSFAETLVPLLINALSS